jgi:hypothetical protein
LISQLFIHFKTTTFMTPLYSHLIVAVVAFVTGIFVYRNNVDLFSPVASRIDDRFDELEKKIEERMEAAAPKPKRPARVKRNKSEKS